MSHKSLPLVIHTFSLSPLNKIICMTKTMGQEWWNVIFRLNFCFHLFCVGFAVVVLRAYSCLSLRIHSLWAHRTIIGMRDWNQVNYMQDKCFTHCTFSLVPKPQPLRDLFLQLVLCDSFDSNILQLRTLSSLKERLHAEGKAGPTCSGCQPGGCVTLEVDPGATGWP